MTTELDKVKARSCALTNDFIDTLELSVRAGNVLRNNGITTPEQFMALTKPQVLSFTHAGSRTWREIYEVQFSLRREARRQTLPGRAVELIRALNDLDLGANGFFLTFDDKHRLRLARYAKPEDLDEHG
ncbi:DNA-directed RNA polymerase subunit alpha C-terminal domain-containing protein [Mesorhizobium sp. L-8-3]|uniref:DNA-directed RNA polymerase subunit alpha C-terminal domain-containing protein n=1 Tax=Mesorhizobium sp. L-8-3 TaxID=2744522 RepID=UPI001927E9B4|nr:DNA-directed RNA polymerase subunit alpha C-terminal domain-containing protein [Mesorhizobium sp. L-8-3]BCH24285.1 hypothetical protein MesoLjLb_40700 [Mesorhizobium sp. L-8-3]